MARKRNRESAEVNSSSMADIAFLLLVFFLVTTTIPNERGLIIQLPQKSDEPPIVELKDRNVFTVKISSSDKLLVEGEILEDPYKIREMLVEHIMNPNKDDKKAESPQVAVVSLKNNRGSSYQTFITVLDQLQAGYYEIYGERAGGLTAEEFRNLDKNNPKEKALYEKGKGDIPMAISIAQPN